MALVPRRDPWGKRSYDPYSNETRSRWRLYAQGFRGIGYPAAGMRASPNQRAYGAGNFGGVRTPRFGRSTYNGGYNGGYGGYGGYGRYSYSGLPRPGMWTSPYRNSYSRYPSRSSFSYGRGYGKYSPQYPQIYRNYSPCVNRYRPYQRPSYYDEEYYSSDEDYDSDGEDDSYSPQYNREYKGYATDWDDDDDDLFDEDELDDMEDYDSDFDDGGYDSDLYGFNPYKQGYSYGGYGGYNYNKRGYR